MKTASELRADSHRTQYDTLVADGELALTFVRLAAASSDVEVRNRRLTCAIQACELMSRRMPYLDLDETAGSHPDRTARADNFLDHSSGVLGGCG